jgi:hypothetical protein
MKTTKRIDDMTAELELAYIAWLRDVDSDCTFVALATTLIPQENVLARIALATGEGIVPALRRLQHAAGIL